MKSEPSVDNSSEAVDSKDIGGCQAEKTVPAPTLEGGAYEIIRNRLAKHGNELRNRLETLDEDRKTAFGTIQSALLTTQRVTTEYNCIARDMVALGCNRFLFGYNVQMGLKSTMNVADVFAVFDFNPTDLTFRPHPGGILNDPAFLADFQAVYHYYRSTFFTKAMVIGPHLYMVMQTGREVTDFKVFKWLQNSDGTLSYLGNRFDHEYVYPSQQEFEWKRAHRDMHRKGAHPHISIEDRLFVETLGGDLTVKIEDNTATGQGIYSEDVTNHDQTLDDAEVFYAVVGSIILLKVLPYQEKHYRYLLYCEKVQKVYRVDAIADSCVLLPDGHGLIFSSGYVLQTGEIKLFDNGLRDMRFERRIASSNGEDFLYAFFNRESGEYILLCYNLISRTVQTPIICNGYSLFPNGELLFFKADDQPQKHHAIQVWRTPFLDTAVTAPPAGDSFLQKIGNAEIVRCMAECQAIKTLLGKDDTYADLYVDLVKTANDLLDAYFWIDKPEASQLSEPLREIRATAQAAIEEFEKVRRLRKVAADAMKSVGEKTASIVRAAETAVGDGILEYVRRLASLREERGEIIGLKDVRYADPAVIESMEKQIVAAAETLSKRCVEFLLQPNALDPYRSAIADQQTAIAKVAKVIEAAAIEDAFTKAGADLEMLIEIVGNLKIEDATQTTRIIDDISAIYATLNQAKVELRNRRKELAKVEGAAQFGAQLKLLAQATVNYLDLADSTAKCDEFQTRLFVQIEELEGRFGEFDDYVEQLSAKREEVGDAFEQRRQSLTEARNRRASTLLKSGERILQGIRRRVEALGTVPEIHGYLASDLMVEKLREITRELTEIGENVKADDLQTQLKTLREDAVRQLKDRQELFVGGADLIQFGAHRFSVNKQPLDLSVVVRGDEMSFHLNGTAFYERIDDADFNSTKPVWEQEIVSENRSVYRGETLAWMFHQTLNGQLPPGEGVNIPHSVSEFRALNAANQMEAIQRFMAPQYAYGWSKGVHDQDALIILRQLLACEESAGLLCFEPAVRACAGLFWKSCPADPAKEMLTSAIRSFGAMQRTLGPAEHGLDAVYLKRLTARIREFQTSTGLFAGLDPCPVAAYLFAELTLSGRFVVSASADKLRRQLTQELAARGSHHALDEALAPLRHDPVAAFEVARDWLRSLVSPEAADLAAEAATHLVCGEYDRAEVRDGAFEAELSGLAGNHPLIGSGGVYAFHYHRFVSKLRRFITETIPLYDRYQHRKGELVRARRDALRLDEFKPKVMTSFVRNRLINDVYLPLIGANLAKQIGTAGADTRTDRSGLLLLISPPGYGKTTLMEYVANRLGITFMKINGPALGNRVTSLDPGEAPNASAREEIQRLNLALEMGDNVMLYLDDIQHCNPEFLQKFISLCDAQRKIEGVYQGHARTYDLRGKKVAVVMAGNPYTESGEKFRIPDMLANRADTYNLGDILGGHEAVFEDSYIENALTSSPVLSRLASRSQKDVYALLTIARNNSQEGVDFEGNYAVEEIDEMVIVTRKLLTLRDIVLKVNQEYIRSAGQTEAYRTEPAFKLQGSYRNMNRMAEKTLPLLTDDELKALILDHYRNESQVLTTGAESNFLKFRELSGWLTEAEAARWEEIKKTFRRRQLLGGSGDNDPITRIVGQLSAFGQGLEAIETVLKLAHESRSRPATLADETVQRLERIIAGLRAVPVDVEIKVMPVQQGAMEDAAQPPQQNCEVSTAVEIRQEA